MKPTPEDEGAVALEWYVRQDARDGAGQLRAIERGARNRERLERGEVTEQQLTQEMDDDVARIGLVSDERWDAMSHVERREALRKAYGRYPV